MVARSALPLGVVFLVFAAPVRGALVQLVRLDDGAGPTAIAEVGPNGTYEDFSAGDFGQAKASPLASGTSVSFPGESASPFHRLNLGDSGGVLGGLTSATVSMWVNFSSITSDHTFLSIGAFAAASNNVIFWRDEDNSSVGNSTDTIAVLVGPNRTAGTTNALGDTNAWHHVAFTYQANTTDGLVMYVDGLQNGAAVTTTSAAIPTNGANPLTVGNVSASPVGDKDLIGLVDEIAIYDTALPPEQIAQLAAGVDPTVVPEPSVLAFAGMAAAFGLMRRRARGSPISRGGKYSRSRVACTARKGSPEGAKAS